jgi:hypothetical protein
MIRPPLRHPFPIDPRHRRTLIDRNGVAWAAYPVTYCPHCDRDTPHAGPFCQVCGHDSDEADQ